MMDISVLARQLTAPLVPIGTDILVSLTQRPALQAIIEKEASACLSLANAHPPCTGLLDNAYR